jgi:N-carbamoyl-L-amino-acid hydrolase
VNQQAPKPNPLVDGKRLWSRLMRMAEIGATEKGGVCRLALSEFDRQSRDLFSSWCEVAGCTVSVDAMGNMFARRGGTDSGSLPIAAGSHLDSQPTGGKFDGALGVLAALEVIETLNDHGIKTRAPIEAVVWTNEEGARFTPPMIGSGVYCGVFDLDHAHGRKDAEGVSLGEALDAIGYRGEVACGAHPLGAHFELHIEQGPILGAKGLDLGIVTGVQGIRWYELQVHGSETHAGPCPMSMRQDPVPVLAALVSELYALALNQGDEARCTIGRMNAEPGSVNTVPSCVKVSVDLRHPNPAGLARLDQGLRDLAAKYDGDCRVEVRDLWHSPPVAFHPDCIEAVAAAAEAFGLPVHTMVSGAGHDSVYVSRVAPTGMIFVPCKEGRSHNEAEETRPEQAELGANVLLHAMIGRAGRARAHGAGGHGRLESELSERR